MPRPNAQPRQAFDAEVEDGVCCSSELPTLHGCVVRAAVSYSLAMEDRIPTRALLNSQDQVARGQTFSSAGRSPYRGSAALVILAASLPIIASGGSFFVDAPNHLFRMALGDAMLKGHVESEFFQASNNLYPNLAIDAFGSLLSSVVPPAASLTLFICMAVGVNISAVVWCRHVRGERTDLPLLLIILLAVYSEPLYWGLFNYILGLGVMFIALHRASEKHNMPSDKFAVSQALIVGTMCVISIFPVMLYVCFCLGMLLITLYDDWCARRFAESRNLLKSHWLSAILVIGLLTVIEPGQSGKTEWHLVTKITGIFSFGKTTNLPFEYLLSAIVLGVVAWLASRRGVKASRHEVAGLLACCLLFIVMPKELMSVGAADRRLVPAILTIAAIFVRGPSHQTVRIERVATELLAVVVVLKLGLLIYLWAPLTELDAAYVQITKEVPQNAIVLFVPPVKEARPDAVERAKHFVRLVSTFQPVPAAEAHVFVEHPHLLLRSLAGQHVLPTQVFTNFWAKKIPQFRELPNPATSQTLADVAAALTGLPQGIVSYVISHIDLNDALAPEVSLRKIAEIGPVRLYTASRAEIDLFPLHRPHHLSRSDS